MACCILQLGGTPRLLYVISKDSSVGGPKAGSCHVGGEFVRGQVEGAGWTTVAPNICHQLAIVAADTYQPTAYCAWLACHQHLSILAPDLLQHCQQLCRALICNAQHTCHLWVSNTEN